MALDALSDDEKRSLIISVGTHRGERALSPVEVADLFQKAINGGASLTECAAFVHLQPTQVSRFLALTRLPEAVQHLIDWGRGPGTIPFSAGFELSRLETDEDQRDGVEASLEHALGTAEVRQLVQARRRSGKSMDDCVRSVVGMRPQVVVRHLLVGSILGDRLRARLRSLTQQQRDSLFQSASGATLKAMHASGRLGPDRFTMVGGSELSAVLSHRDEIERTINAQLEAEVPNE